MGVLRPHFWGAIIFRKRYVLGVARSLCGSWAYCCDEDDDGNIS